MSKESGKKQSNKKIKYTPAGESKRNYKNKPFNERIGIKHSKNTFKINKKDIYYLKNSRNGKRGLKNITNDATNDPMGNWHIVPFKIFRDLYGFDSSFVSKINGITSSSVGEGWYPSPSKNNFMTITKIIDDTGRLIGKQINKHKIQKIRKTG